MAPKLQLTEKLALAVKNWAADQGMTDSEAISRLIELGLTVAQARAPTEGQRSRAVTLADQQIDRMSDNEASTDDQADRKDSLLKGPSAFRDVRKDRSK